MAPGGISKTCFIFPNRRSQVFFTKYLGEAVKEVGTPIVAPKMLTINDFFFRISGGQAGGQGEPAVGSVRMLQGS